MLPIQIILLVFFLVAIVKAMGRFRAGEITGPILTSWVVFWIIAGVIVVDPNSTATVAKAFGVGRGADVVVYLALAGLFFIVFRLMVKQEKMSREITRLTREIALKNK